MAQKFADRIDYCYVYRMNIVTIYVIKTNNQLSNNSIILWR